MASCADGACSFGTAAISGVAVVVLLNSESGWLVVVLGTLDVTPLMSVTISEGDVETALVDGASELNDVELTSGATEVGLDGSSNFVTVEVTVGAASVDVLVTMPSVAGVIDLESPSPDCGD